MTRGPRVTSQRKCLTLLALYEYKLYEYNISVIYITVAPKSKPVFIPTPILNVGSSATAEKLTCL